MSNKDLKHNKNVAGAFYCTDPSDSNGEGCISCGLCYGSAGNFFKSDDDGSAYVAKQPTTDSERAECQSAMDNCPVSAIGNDG